MRIIKLTQAMIKFWMISKIAYTRKMLTIDGYF